MLFFSTSKSDSEIFLQKADARAPILLIKRHAQEEWASRERLRDRCYVEHIQEFFIVVKSSALKAFEVFLVHEKDVFAGEIQAKPSQGLIDRCFEQGKFVQLTPTPVTATSKLIPDSYRIFDMDILKVEIENERDNNASNTLFCTKKVVMDIASDLFSSICMIIISASRNNYFPSITSEKSPSKLILSLPFYISNLGY